DKYRNSDHFHFASTTSGGYTPVAFLDQVAAERHDRAAQYLFLDWHVESLKWNKIQGELNRDGSYFIHPHGHGHTGMAH
ncbi:MAG: hypothetical protein ACXW3L_02670, partial [Limisphaerales bacterium]